MRAGIEIENAITVVLNTNAMHIYYNARQA